MFPSVRMRIVKTFLAAVAGLPDCQTDLKNPNFAKLAEAIGMMGVRIENPADVSSGLKSAHQHSGPGLIDVVTDPNALSLPSHIEPEMVVGFGLTMVVWKFARPRRGPWRDGTCVTAVKGH